MIDPRPLSPPEFTSHEELAELADTFDLLTYEEANEMDTYELEQLLKDHFNGW